MTRIARQDLPTGTVTFMFSDIEGSTRLVQQLPERFPKVLEQHQALMRAALARHGGVEVSTEGDSFFAVFSSPGDALAAAAEVQRAHAGHEFPGQANVRVRIGLHAGAGTRGGDNYVGLDVHRGARIASAAHGGDVLISESTRALVADGLPGGVSLRDVGNHRLKDLESPERLYRLVIDGLRDDFPPPRSLGSAANLPHAASSFVGREQELEELSALLARTHLLTLTGPGGTGKTRLALETARRAAEGYRDGAYFVPLEAIRDPALVASAAAQALGVPGTRSAEEALVSHLRDRQLLLIFDNFEQVAAAAALVDRILAGAPEVRVIVTSRVPLQLYGEQEYRVAPLMTPTLGKPTTPEALSGVASVALFVERARAVDPTFALTGANAAAVAEICVRLDGLPLAIELAATRVKLLPPAAILARLGKRLEILAVQSPNLAPRQRTLRAAIDWSWELLSETERALFERLAVFRGGWDLETAEAVCRPAELGIDLLDDTASLLDKSLVVRAEADEPRFTMLQTIGEYAHERLVARGEADTIAHRHALHFRDLAEAVEPSFGGADPAAGVARLLPEQDNLRAALAWALEADDADVGLRLAAAIWRFWQERGQLREGRRWLEQLLALPAAAGPTAVRARGLTALAGIAYWQGDSAARGFYEEALAIKRELGDAQGIADSLQNLAFTVMGTEREKGIEIFRESLARYRELKDERSIASVVGALGYAHLMLGQHDEARVAIKEALALNEVHGVRNRANDNRFALGHLDRLAGNLPAAAVHYRDALLDAQSMGDAARMLMHLRGIASYLLVAGRAADAVRLAGAVARATEEQGGTIGVPLPGVTDPVEDLRASGALSEAEVEQAVALGRAMDLDAAVDFALAALLEADEDKPRRG